MTAHQWDEVIDVNLTGIYRATRAFVQEITGSACGRIVNLSSVVGLAGNIGQGNYAASKSGMVGLSKSLACELAPTGAPVDVFAHGCIDMPMVQQIPQKVMRRILSWVPRTRFGPPQEMADDVLHLASTDADYITGMVPHRDGGHYV